VIGDPIDPPPADVLHQAVEFRPPLPLAGRLLALIEVLVCSGYPTQLFLVIAFNAFGFLPTTENGALSAAYVAALSLIDSTILIGLMVFFLRSHGESPRHVFLNGRPPLQESLIGLPLTFAALILGALVLLAVQRFAPSLHNVPHNPLEDVIQRPGDVWLFALVVIVAGGVREELQRAFVLHRFRVWLGGARLGLLLGSVAFGAGHLVQGADAAIATGVLGLFWGLVYLGRRSVVAPMVSHSGFDLLQIGQYLLGHGVGT
jgi:membrane protease YdiL (CAAX protease family)